MSFESGRHRGVVYRGRLYRRRPLIRIALAVLLAAGLASWLTAQSPSPAPLAQAPVPATPGPLHPLLDARLALGASPARLGDSAPLASWQAASLPAEPPPEDAPPPALALPPVEAPGVAVPLPTPRPLDLIAPRGPETPRLAAPAAAQRRRIAAKPPAIVEDNRNFFEKLFGVTREPGPQIAYAAPQDDVLERGRGFRLSPLPATPEPALLARTAIYDIEANLVLLPNGERLEAHSGFGDKMDDVRFAHVRMKGVTPPHVYNLVEREALFDGHRAIRLHPVGGSGAIFGRAGLLAHPYLLGPRGDSNGCVSVKDYDRLLQAYLRGEIRRLVVVPRGGASAAAVKLAAQGLRQG